MPEGDTVFRAAARLRPVLVGKTLTKTDFRVPRFATLDLRGRTVDEITTYGKHLFLHIDTVSVHTHLKMEGVWHSYPLGERWRRPGFTARLVLDTAETQVVGFSLGVLEVLSLATEHTVTDHLGPDLLGPNWDPAEVVRRLEARPDRPIGLALLDQANLAGIGNVFRSEVCFRCRLHPATPVGSVSDLPGLVAEAHRILTKAAHEPPRQLLAYGRQRRPCPRCRTALVVHLLGDPEYSAERERAIYFCPRCQPAPK